MTMTGIGGMARHNRRWTQDEDQVLRELAGTMRTEHLARKLGRTVGAVWSRCSYLKISLYAEDGRYTASELARALGLPRNTVISWCRSGIVKARKVGRRTRSGMWRIDWDGLTPLPIQPDRVLGSTMRFALRQGDVKLKAKSLRSQSNSA